MEDVMAMRGQVVMRDHGEGLVSISPSLTASTFKAYKSLHSITIDIVIACSSHYYSSHVIYRL